MIDCKEINDYLQYVKDHPKWINKDRKLLIKNVVKPTLQRKDIVFKEEVYRNCLAYFETNYYPLFLYEKFILAFVFMYEESGEPVFPEIVILEGRGNGKDGFMAPLANFFQTPLHGVRNYNVELVANSEKQIKDTFIIPYNMLSDNAAKFKGHFTWTKELITNLDTGSELRYNTSNSATADGKRPGCIFFNEYHAYENYDNINVYESAEGKVPGFREIIITTQGYVRDGPLDNLLDDCRKILDTGTNPLGIFPFLCRLDKESEVHKPEYWYKANPSLEYLPVLQKALERGYLKAKNNPEKMAEFITKRMNLPQQKQETAVTSWTNILYTSYNNVRTKTPRRTPETKGQLAIIGIDYADVRDFASAGVLTLTDDGEYIWRQHTWICAASPYLEGIKFPIGNAGQKEFMDFEVVDAPVIPVEGIIDWAEARMAEYSVQKITMDTYRYSLFREKFNERGISIETKENPAGLVRLVRRLASVTGVIAPTIEQLFSEKKINFGQSAIMRWYTNNTALKADKFGNYTYIKIEPIRRKNDGFMAFVVAMYSANLLKENVVYV